MIQNFTEERGIIQVGSFSVLFGSALLQPSKTYEIRERGAWIMSVHLASC